MMQNNSIKKIIAGVAAVATAAIGLGMAAPAAMAADTLGNIDASAKGTLTIEKHKQTSTNGTTRGDGTQQTITDGDVLAGVKFNVYKTDFDMTKQSNWDHLADLTASGSNIMYNNTTVGTIDMTTPAYSGTTDVNGQIKFTKVPVGLYYVVEGDYTGSEGQITSKAQPFFVSMPYPNANKAWNYNVYVYPKNNFGTTVKRVDADSVKSSIKVGDQIKWNIDQDVPAHSTDNPITKFGVVDKLDSHVSYNSVVVSALDSDGNAVANSTFVQGTDYTVTQTTKDGSNYVDIAFTAAGLTKVANYSKVRFALTTTVSADLTDYTVPNSVYPVINNYDPYHKNETTPPVPSEDQPYYGDFAFQKVDDQTPAKALNGATFKLWRKSVAGCDVSNDEIPSNALTAVSGTTDSLNKAVTVDGKVVFTGVLIGKAAKGQTGDQLKNITDDFCLRETQAPAGFVTPAISATQPVTLHAGRNASNPEDINTIADVKNTKEQGPNLPLTGAAGRMILILGSIAVLAAAAALFVVNQRRQRANR